MNQNEKPAFGGLMASVADLYGKTMTNGVAEIYWQALRAYDFADIQRAAGAHALDPDAGQYMPKPADFVRHIDGSKASQASVAWAKVVDAIRSQGSYKSVCFDDPMIHAAIQDMGGWIKVCAVLEKDLPFEERRFATSYNGYKLRGVSKGDYPPYLIGAAEGENRSNGKPVAPPLLLGNQEKAQAVLSGGEFKARVAIPAIQAVSKYLENAN